MINNDITQTQSKKNTSRIFRYLTTTTVQTFFILIAIGLLLAVSLTKLFTSEAFIITVAVLSNIIWFTAFAVFPFIYVLKTGKFFEGFLRSWFFNLFVVVIVSIIIPGVLIATQPEMSGLIVNSFPDSIGVFPVAITGWLPALVICGIANGIHSCI